MGGNGTQAGGTGKGWVVKVVRGRGGAVSCPAQDGGRTLMATESLVVGGGWGTAIETSSLIDQIEQFLQGMIAQLTPDASAEAEGGPGRPRGLPALALWGGLLVCVLHGFSSQLDLW